MIPVKSRGASGLIIVLFIGVLVWLIISTVTIYHSSLRASNSEQFAQEMAMMTGYVVEMSQEFAEIAQQWRVLAYRLNPEAAVEMEKVIREHYRNEGQQEQKQKGLWVKL